MLWMVIQDDIALMEDRDETSAQLIDMAEDSDPNVQYLVSKLYQGGPLLISDSIEVWYWFEQSALAAQLYAWRS